MRTGGSDRVEESFPLTSSVIDLGILKDVAGNLHTQAVAHIPNAWVYVTDIFDNAGNMLTSEYLQSIWVEGNPGALRAGLAATHHAVVTFQPADRFWAFQGIETAVFLGLALLLAGLCFWWLRRRIA